MHSCKSIAPMITTFNTMDLLRKKSPLNTWTTSRVGPLHFSLTNRRTSSWTRLIKAASGLTAGRNTQFLSMLFVSLYIYFFNLIDKIHIIFWFFAGVDYWKVVFLITGVLLFLSAEKLSKNTLFYYICGVSFGVGASFLILIYFVSKLFPKVWHSLHDELNIFSLINEMVMFSQKPMMYGVAVCGWTVGVYILQLLWDNLRVILVNYQSYVAWYIFLTGLISFVGKKPFTIKLPKAYWIYYIYYYIIIYTFILLYILLYCLHSLLYYLHSLLYYSHSLLYYLHSLIYSYIHYLIRYLISHAVCYRWGPVTNERTRNLIRWSLKLAGITSVFFSSQYQEAAMGQIVILLTVHHFPQSWLNRSKSYW